MNHCRKVMLQQSNFFSWYESRQNENGLPHADFPHRNPFVGAGHAKPVRARLLQSPGDLRAAVAVRISLHNGKDFARSLAFFVCRVHVLANGFEVVGQGA